MDGWADASGWGSVAGALGPLAGGLVSSAMSPRVTGGGSNYYTPTGMSAADQQWQNIQRNLYNTFNQKGLDQYGLQSLYAGLNANQNQGVPYQNWADQAGQLYGNLSGTMQQQSGQNFATQQDLLGAGKNVYNMGLDPQQALYNRTRQQVQDQTGATNSMYGLGSSAAGAGLANQALSNFNIDWQNQQLQRALQGLQGYGSAAGTAAGYGNLATNQAAAAPGYALQAGQVPYQVAQGLAAMPGALGSQYGQYLNQNLYGPGQALQSGALQYMGYGQGAQQIPYQGQLQGAGALGSMASQALRGGAQQYFSPGTSGWGNIAGNLMNGGYASSLGSFGLGAPGAYGGVGDALGSYLGTGGIFGSGGGAVSASPYAGSLDSLASMFGSSFSGGSGASAAGAGTAGAGAAGVEGGAGLGGAGLGMAALTAAPFLLAAGGMLGGVLGYSDNGTPYTQAQDALASAMLNNPSLLQQYGNAGAGNALNAYMAANFGGNSWTMDQYAAAQRQLAAQGGGAFFGSFLGGAEQGGGG